MLVDNIYVYHNIVNIKVIDLLLNSNQIKIHGSIGQISINHNISLLVYVIISHNYPFNGLDQLELIN